MAKRKPLPLSSELEPLNVVFHRCWKRLQDFKLAQDSLQQDLATGELVAKRCDPGKPLRWEKASYWKDARLERNSADPLMVAVVEPDGSLSQAQFFVGAAPERESVLEDDTEQTVPHKQTGRPPYNWPQIDPVIRCYISDTSAGRPKQEDFIKAVREWCRREGWKVPGKDAIEKRIQHLKKQPFAAD